MESGLSRTSETLALSEAPGTPNFPQSSVIIASSQTSKAPVTRVLVVPRGAELEIKDEGCHISPVLSCLDSNRKTSENKASSSKGLVALEPEPSQIPETGAMPETTGNPAHPHTLEAQASGISVVLYKPDPEQATDAADWQTPPTVVVNPKLTWYDGNMMELEMPSERVLYGTEAVSDFPGIKAFVPIDGSTKAPGDIKLISVTQLFYHESISQGIRRSLATTNVTMEKFSKWEEIKSRIGHI
ncbi:hypothetical protein FOXG_22667 [Fusarium oxysporum f. sp. lycopersici 4287]|nr:hypothetical protein FOXG_21316 [Fusarium oxysporum f. sp. lycopersici 4287]XP_018257932.1 hypothetical protein FOXG_22667 [Fusarium oxysporum f. sp. lycopersici 4287]KNB15423.1 hypothetical protein FOXG_21316 [Fusarium oxysporum f. sp. lycopersici 4287]KNB19887.1 hypothetical protein FOXG_22667 [Fusarium oxysporum f. sp. lycopersici 4287]